MSKGPLRSGEGPPRSGEAQQPATPHGRISAEVRASGPDLMFHEMGDAETREL